MTGQALFSSVTANFLNNPVTLIYDADFDRLMIAIAPNGSGVSSVQMGASIETLVDLANNLGPQVQPWFCLPHMYDSASITSWATYIRDHLNPAIKFNVELSNEVWNTQVPIYIQTNYYQNKGALRWSQSPVNNTDVIYQYYGYRFRVAMLAIETVFSGQMSRVNRVFGHRYTDSPVSSVAVNRMQCPNEGYTAGNYPINHADSLCIAQYYNTSRTGIALDAAQVWNVVYSGDPVSVQAGLNYFDGRMRSDNVGQGSMLYWAGVTGAPFPNLSGQFKAWRDCATTYSVLLTCYEGGFNNLSGTTTPWTLTNNPYTPPSTGLPVTITQADVTSMMYAYWNSNQYAIFLREAVAAFTAAGGQYPAQYCLVNTTWADQNPFSMIVPSRPGAAGVTISPAYAIWRTVNSG
jgi:hypothetical protein